MMMMRLESRSIFFTYFSRYFLCSILELQTSVVALYDRPTNTACLGCIECTDNIQIIDMHYIEEYCESTGVS